MVMISLPAQQMAVADAQPALAPGTVPEQRSALAGVPSANGAGADMRETPASRHAMPGKQERAIE
jgi:hypothetical protein